MSVILADSLSKREFPKGLSPEDKAMLLRASRIPLAETIKGESLPPRTRLLKAYATSAAGPRRIVWLLQVEEGDLFFLFCRDKNDAVGENISLNNPDFRSALKKHLKLLATDLVADAWMELAPDDSRDAPSRTGKAPAKKPR